MGKGCSRPLSGLLQPMGEACPGQQEQLNKGCSQAVASSSSLLRLLLLLLSLPHSCHPSALPGCGQAQGLSPTEWPDPFTKPGHRPQGLPWTGPPTHRPWGCGNSRIPVRRCQLRAPALWPAAQGEGVRAMRSDRNSTGPPGPESGATVLPLKSPWAPGRAISSPSALPGQRQQLLSSY